MFTALGRPGLVDAADCLGITVFLGNDSLTPISHFFFIPNDRFEEPLKGSRSNLLVQRDCFDVFALHVREQTANVSPEQAATLATGKAASKPGQKLGKQFSELCDILD